MQAWGLRLTWLDCNIFNSPKDVAVKILAGGESIPGGEGMERNINILKHKHSSS